MISIIKKVLYWKSSTFHSAVDDDGQFTASSSGLFITVDLSTILPGIPQLNCLPFPSYLGNIKIPAISSNPIRISNEVGQEKDEDNNDRRIFYFNNDVPHDA
jgi:hypothetical protein